MGAWTTSGILHVIEKRIDGGETLDTLLHELESVLEDVSGITEELKESALEKAH